MVPFANETPSMGGVRTNITFVKNNGGVSLAVNLGTGTGNLNIADTVTAWPSFALSAWHHIALVRNGAHYYAYVDGVKTHDIASASACYLPTNLVIIPAQYNGYNLFGYVDEFRFSAVCEYPGGTTFTPPSAPFV